LSGLAVKRKSNMFAVRETESQQVGAHFIMMASGFQREKLQNSTT
jgi:hypothetical protein